MTIPTEFGFAPGNGALVQAVVATTGVRPRASGKPDPLIFKLALERVAAVNPVIIGDRLDTDMAGARNSGYPGLAVLTGVSKAADVFLARANQRPRLIAKDLRALELPHLAPRRSGDIWEDGGARAWVDGNRLVVEDGQPDSDGPSSQAIRACAEAVWAAADQGVQIDPESIPAAFAA
jgi:hypothetical protein